MSKSQLEREYQLGLPVITGKRKRARGRLWKMARPVEQKYIDNMGFGTRREMLKHLALRKMVRAQSGPPPWD